jgi:hypothetical protein
MTRSAIHFENTRPDFQYLTVLAYLFPLFSCYSCPSIFLPMSPFGPSCSSRVYFPSIYVSTLLHLHWYPSTPPGGSASTVDSRSLVSRQTKGKLKGRIPSFLSSHSLILLHFRFSKHNYKFTVNSLSSYPLVLQPTCCHICRHEGTRCDLCTWALPSGCLCGNCRLQLGDNLG